MRQEWEIYTDYLCQLAAIAEEEKKKFTGNLNQRKVLMNLIKEV